MSGRETSAASLGLVERVPCRDWAMWPLSVSTETGQYFAALAQVRPGQEVELPALMAASQVERMGKPAQAWRYLTSAATLGRSFALRAVGPVAMAVGSIAMPAGSLLRPHGLRENHHSLAPVFSRQPQRRKLPFSEKTVTAFILKRIWQLWSQRSPIPIKL